MSNITVRFVHRQSRTPVLELEVEASITVGALREFLMERLASEEVCMMRVFVKWHVEVAFGGRKRLIELTDEDVEASLSSHGISHLSEVHLDGPLTGNGSDGVGQALAVLGAQMHQIQKSSVHTNTLLESIVASVARPIQMIATVLYVSNRLAHLPSEEYLARQTLVNEASLRYGQLMVVERAEEGCQRLLAEATAGFHVLLTETDRGPFTLAIDRTTPRTTFSISEDGTTATKIADGWATWRSSHPLTTTNHTWAFKIMEDGRQALDMIIGLLPKLSDAQVAIMEGDNGFVGSSALGGWSMWSDGAKYGNWECLPFRFAKGDTIVYHLNFADKTLTLSCGDRRAVGTIPSIKEGDEPYPAVTMYHKGQQVALLAV